MINVRLHIHSYGSMFAVINIYSFTLYTSNNVKVSSQTGHIICDNNILTNMTKLITTNTAKYGYKNNKYGYIKV